MKIRNQVADAIPSNMSLVEFGKAMSQVNLDGVPPEKKAQAIKDHFARVMADSIHDRQLAQELHISRILRAKK